MASPDECSCGGGATHSGERLGVELAATFEVIG